MKVLQAGDPGNKVIQFEWFLTNWCNFKCSYCSEATNMVESFSKSTSAGKYKLVLVRLKKLEHPFTVEIIGGEPTLHPNIGDILAELGNIENCQRIQIVTNLSRSLSFYKHIAHPKVSLIASYHPEHHTDDFITKAAQLDRVNVSVSLHDNPSYWQQTINMIDRMKAGGINYTFNMLTSTPLYKVNYTQQFYDVFEKYVNEIEDNEQIPYVFEDGTTRTYNEMEIVKKGLHKLKGYLCVPLRYRITHDGDIHNFCTGRVLPIILGDTPYTQEVCPNTQCGCDALFIMHKKRI